jgi:uncharacterized delta-60 repeat protein
MLTRKTLFGLMALCTTAANAQLSGELDLTFSSDGIATCDFPSNYDDRGLCMLVQPDGKILMGGGSHQGTGVKFALARFMPDGSLDASFGNGGRVATQVGSPPNLDEAFYALALQPDGKIVAAGRSYAGNGYLAAVLRYNANGTLDNTFSSDGKQLDNLGAGNDDAYYGVAVQPDGSIVVGGVAKASAEYDAVVARYTAAGALDATFSGDGYSILDIGMVDNRANALVLQPDGKIVIAGQTGNAAVDSDFLLARFTTTGTLDTGFGTNGTVISAFSTGTDWAYALTRQPDGKLIAGGLVTNGAAANIGLARYDADGELDATFGSDGLTFYNYSNACFARSIALMPDGRIAVAGNSAVALIAAMFNADGSVDNNFNLDGVATPTLGGTAFGYAAAVQADYKLLVAGQAVQGAAQNNFVIARYYTGMNIGIEEVADAVSDLRVLPNPTRDALDLRCNVAKSERITINLLDAQGRAVEALFSGAVAVGEQRLRIALPEAMAPGAYTIAVSGERGALGHARFVKE